MMLLVCFTHAKSGTCLVFGISKIANRGQRSKIDIGPVQLVEQYPIMSTQVQFLMETEKAG